MATVDKTNVCVPFNGGVNASLVSQSPRIFDLLVSAVGEDTTYLGYWAEIAVFDANFQSDTTSIILGSGSDATGINLSTLNGKLSQGHRIPGHFSSITIPSGSTMQIIAFRF